MGQASAGSLPGLGALDHHQAGRGYYLTSNVITIGHALDNDVQLGDPGVAPHHACIRWQRAGAADEFLIYDLGSPADVQVNGVTIAMRHPLAHGDRITIGGAVLELFIPDE